MSFLVRFQQPRLSYAVTFEDDDRVAYAYLSAEEKIVADVWLYNVVPPAREPEWRTGGKPPFLNSVDYVEEGSFEPVTNESDIKVEWVLSSGGDSLQKVLVHLRGEPFAVLKPGIKPGWSRLARNEGPLAKVLTSEIIQQS